MNGTTWRSDAIALVLATGALNSLMLSGLRRPVHDTFLGIVHMRSWLSDAISAGDFPWWMPNVRYGFSVSTLHYASNILNPIGLLLAIFFPYDLRTFGLDLALNSLLGAVGTYLTARRVLNTSIASLAVAVSFVGSAVVWMASGSGVVHPGFMSIPWVFLALVLISQADDFRTLAGSTGLLAISLAWLVASGYPPTWLTLPIFALPFIVVIAGTSLMRLGSTMFACASASVLAAAILAPWIAETIFTPIFGGAIRNLINPNEGAFPLSGIFGLFLVNPEFFPGAEHAYRPPVYLGLISGLALIWRTLGVIPAFIPRIRPVFAPFGAFCLTLCTIPLPSAHTTQVMLLAGASVSWPRETLAFAGLIALLLSAIPASLTKWTRTDTALASTSALVWICATENPIGAFLRTSLPPFTFIRYGYYYLGIATLTDLLLAWRSLEVAVMAAHTRRDTRSWQPFGYALASIGVAVAGTIFIPSPGSASSGGGARIGLVIFVWAASACLMFVVAGSTSWRFAKRGEHSKLFVFGIPLIGAPAAIAASTLISGILLSHDEVLVHAYLTIPPVGQVYVDAAHALLVTGFATVIWRLAPRRILLHSLAIIAIADVVIASPRYLSDTDMVIAGQPFHTWTPHRSFDFSGTNRDPSVRGLQAGMLTKRPGAEPASSLMPEVRTLDESFGAPALFDQFAHFPSKWTAVGPTEIWVVPESFGWEARPKQSVRTGVEELPVCPDNPAIASIEPSATIVKFLSSVVELRVFSDCARLLVYSDSWAEGWKASVDSIDATSLRVNGAIRGVIVPEGEHEVTWTYRPAYWAITKWVASFSLFATGCVLAWGLLSPNIRRSPIS